MKLELSAEVQQSLLDEHEDNRKGVELTKAWADEKIQTLSQAIHQSLGNGENSGAETRSITSFKGSRK
jgi:hypothetical protein